MNVYVSVPCFMVSEGDVPAISRCEDEILPFRMFADQERSISGIGTPAHCLVEDLPILETW